MSNALWLVGPFPFLFHFHCQIFQYPCINYASWFIGEKNSEKIHVKLQFINGSNFVKLSKRRTKNVSRGSFLFAVSLFWQIQKCSNFVKLSKRMHIRPHDFASFEWILSKFIDGPVFVLGFSVKRSLVRNLLIKIIFAIELFLFDKTFLVKLLSTVDTFKAVLMIRLVCSDLENISIENRTATSRTVYH